MHKFKLSHAKTIVQNLSKESQTFPKRFQTNSSNSENLWRWYVQRLAAFPNADCLLSCKNNMHHLMFVTSQLRHPLRLIGMLAIRQSNLHKYIFVNNISGCFDQNSCFFHRIQIWTYYFAINCPEKINAVTKIASIQLKASQMQKWIYIPG